jgi:hypothetical protein
MRRLIATGLICSLVGCAPTDSSEPGGEDVRLPEVGVIAVAEDATQIEVKEAVDPARLAGRYYVGDGTGYNLDLNLGADGTFDCTWRGCLGVYGTSAGTWALGPDGVTVTAVRSDGMLQEKPLDRLRVATFQGHYLLVRESYLDLFEKWGPTRGSCLHQEAAGAVIDLQWAGWIQSGAVPRTGR